MKKVISVLLLLAICIGCFAGCAPKEDAGLNSAKEYLYAMYKDAEAVTSNDYTVVSQVRINDVVYPITWTADKADNVQIVAGDNNMTTVKITAGAEDVNYKLTATMKNADGLEVVVSFDHMIPKTVSMKEIVEQAYQLEAGAAMEGTYVLTGVISKVNTPWSADYKNITVTIQVAGVEDKPIMCYRLKGDGADALKVGDTITVQGAIKNYNGTIEFDAGCVVSNIIAGTGTAPDNTPSTSNPPATNPPATNPPATNPPATNPPAVSGKVVLSYPKENKFVTGEHSLYAAKNKWQLKLTDSKANAIALEVINNSDNTVTFKAGNQYLFCDATHVKFVTEQSDNTKFVLETTDGGYFVKCAVANYGGKAQYLEVYSGIVTCFGMGTDPSIYVFKLEDGTGANGTIGGLEETPAPDNNTTTTNPPATTTGWTKVSSLNDGDKIVIVNTASNMALSMTKTGFYNNGVDVSSNFNSITNEEIFVVKKNSDGSVTLTSVSGKKVALADSYSSLNEEGANDKWTISDAGDGQSYLKNVGRDIYLEWYADKNNWSAYNPGEDKLTADYVLAFYKQA